MKVKSIREEKRKENLEQWRHTRAIVHQIARMAGRVMKNPNTPIEKFWPMEGDEKYIKGKKRISDLPPEEKKQAINELRLKAEEFWKRVHESKENKN